MSAKFNIALAVAAGFIGGLAARYSEPASIHAQAPKSPPREIEAQRFVLVDETGKARGIFGIEKNGAPVIEISDSNGHVFVSKFDIPGEGINFRQPPYGPKKPTLLPIQP